MPGEQLTCVWQTAFAKGLHNKSGDIPKESIKEIVAEFADLESVHYSERVFKDVFKSDDVITFSSFKRYVDCHLREKGYPRHVLFDEIERKCWELCQPYYKTSLNKEDTRKLWLISNRLTDERSYPPVIRQREGNWFMEKMFTTIGKMWKCSEVFNIKGASFQDLVDIIEDTILRETHQDEMQKSITSLYSSIVTEVMKSGWVYTRTKMKANWTNWAHKWCILTANTIIYCKEESASSKSSRIRGELFITKHTKLLCLEDYSRWFRKMKGRFMVSNELEMDLEIAVGSDKERLSWLSALEEAIKCCREKTTPIQKLLNVRRSLEKKYEHGQTQEGDNGPSTTTKPIISDEKGNRVHYEEDQDEMLRPENLIHANTVKMKTGVVLMDKDGNGLIDRKEFAACLNGDAGSCTSTKTSISDKGSKQDNCDDDEDKKEMLRPENFIHANTMKMKALFMKMDKNGNGRIDRDEFAAFLQCIGLQMTKQETNLVYRSVDRDNKGHVSFDEFQQYFSKHVMCETSSAECVNAMRRAFMEADRDGSGTLNFREFTEYISDKKRSIRLTKVIKAFGEAAKSGLDEISFTDFQQLLQNGASDILMPVVEKAIQKDETSDVFRDHMKQAYDDAEAKEIASYIRDRWNKFATFRRAAATGTVVMTGGHGMVADILPGEYNLLDIACFSDLPPLVPKYTVIKGVKWVSSSVPGKSGKAIFPKDFDGQIVTDLATNELLRYYKCCFADTQQEKVSLLYRHGIQDFTYENGYLEKYVTATNGGAGIEKHDFSHLDCPLVENSGTFVLGKFTDDDEIHITGFKIPVRHTLYIPGGTIHCNDYLSGTWRTMLSDETDIDHVHLTRALSNENDGKYEQFRFKFVSFV
ncbi:uncharacterized protein LOC128214202 [Mya arenaria]|uniref:uncharacterized protein LOC128214202 n=1 Tax=Mya arenaria TaxID=6604 RepID=UPI0022E6D083|nr:uncharacterized protein LOC128214202 [Mya arenaria]